MLLIENGRVVDPASEDGRNSRRSTAWGEDKGSWAGRENSRAG